MTPSDSSRYTTLVKNTSTTSFQLILPSTAVGRREPRSLVYSYCILQGELCGHAATSLADFFARSNVCPLVLQVGHEPLYGHQVLALGLVVHDVRHVLGRDSLATWGNSRERKQSTAVVTRDGRAVTCIFLTSRFNVSWCVETCCVGHG